MLESDNSAVSGLKRAPVQLAECAACSERSIWLCPAPGMGTMVFPADSTAPLAHPDLPERCRGDFDEAREISVRSPRGAAALLRLCIQKLCIELGQPGKDINADIGALVRLGLPTMVQRALDTVRVVGNEAVHPGTMSNEDHAGQVNSLFKLINLIVQHMITDPKEVNAMFAELPPAKRAGIEARDKPKT